MKGQQVERGLPPKGNVLAYSEAAQKWVRINVKYVRGNPTVYPRWVALKDVGRKP